MTIGDINESVSPETVRILKALTVFMTVGMALLAGLAVLLYFREGPVPTAEHVKKINTLTIVAMAWALISIVASEFQWRAALRKKERALSIRVQTAYIVRLAWREGSALLGLSVAIQSGGVLHAYPAYWVNCVPFVLFLAFIAAHWPSAERLTAEARAV